MLAYKKRNLRIVGIAIGIILLFKWLKFHKAAAKNNPLDPLNLIPINDVVWGGGILPTNDGISDTRKYQLGQDSINLYNAMKGAFMDKPMFLRAILDIKTDQEFQYVEKVFGTQKNKGLRDWIDKEWRVTQKVKDQVNNQFMLNDMASRI